MCRYFIDIEVSWDLSGVRTFQHVRQHLEKGRFMKKEYDFNKMKTKKNPFADKLRKQVNMYLDADIITYFKKMAKETDIPYQRLINMYLKDCVKNKKKLNLKWGS